MHKLIPLAALAVALSVGAARAATDAKPAGAAPSEAKTAQQSRMKTCNADARAKDLKGADRKAFMSDCLKKKA
ncbi:MAG: PsiF family protein [Ramlibacter sp.]